MELKMSNKFVNRLEYIDFFKTALILNGSVTPKVITNVFIFMIYAILVSLLGHKYPFLALPIGPFEYGGLILGLLLVFRINAGYDRWWEARKIWGNIVNQSRNLSIIILNYTNHCESEWLYKVTNYIILLPYLIKDYLRDNSDIEWLRSRLDEKTFLKFARSVNRPNLLSLLIANELNTVRNVSQLDSFAFLRADEQREQLTNAQGACERILKTPMPFVMAVKSRRFILFFLLVLPFALINISPLITPWITFLVAYALLALDQISIELQNPFAISNLSHLPLTQICQSIEANIIELRQAKLND